MRAPPTAQHFLNFHAVFLQNLAKSYVSCCWDLKTQLDVSTKLHLHFPCGGRGWWGQGLSFEAKPIIWREFFSWKWSTPLVCWTEVLLLRSDVPSLPSPSKPNYNVAITGLFYFTSTLLVVIGRSKGEGARDALLGPNSSFSSICEKFQWAPDFVEFLSVDFHTFTLQFPIQTLHSVAPELTFFLSSLENCQNFSKNEHNPEVFAIEEHKIHFLRKVRR